MLFESITSAFVAIFTTSLGYIVGVYDSSVNENNLRRQVEQLRERVAELEKEVEDAKENYDELYEEDEEYIEQKQEEFGAELAKKEATIYLLAFVLGGGVAIAAILVYAAIVKASPLLR